MRQSDREECEQILTDFAATPLMKRAAARAGKGPEEYLMEQIFSPEVKRLVSQRFSGDPTEN